MERVLTLRNSLHKSSKNECHVVAWVKAMPECTCDESCKCSPETRLLSLRSNTEVHVVLEPIVGIDVPESKICTSILRCFNLPRLDVGEPIPFGAAGSLVNPVVAYTTKNARAFGKTPNTVVLHARDKAEHVQLPNSTKDVVLHIVWSQVERGVVVCGELQKGKDPERPVYTFDGCGCATARNLSLLACCGSFGGIGPWRKSEHGGRDVVTVVTVIERWASHQSGEEEDISCVVE
jgi:hypothetical protein